MRMLEDELQRVNGEQIDNVLAQCQYFGLSFGRVGADFRTLVIPIFERTILRRMTTVIEAGVTQ